MRPLILFSFLLVYNILFVPYTSELFHYVFIYGLTNLFTFQYLYRNYRIITPELLAIVYSVNLIVIIWFDMFYIRYFDEVNRWCHLNILLFTVYTICVIKQICSRCCKDILKSMSIEELENI